MKAWPDLLFPLLCFTLGGCSPRTDAGNAPYRLAAGWSQLPAGFVLGNPTGIGVDSGGNLMVFCRGRRDWPLLLPMPRERMKTNTIVLLNSADGKMLSSWGANLFIMPHGLKVDSANNIWITDVGLHQVMKFSHDGRRILTLGIAGEPGNDSLHFNRPTDVAAAPDGCFYVSDGYRNSRVVKFSPAGKYLFEWGRKGSGPGEFDIPHGLCLDEWGNVYVADRENRRIEVFDPAGRFLRQFNNLDFGNICALAYDRRLHRIIAVDDKSILRLNHRGSDILILDLNGRLVSRFGRSGGYAGPVCWYHDIALGPDGSIYVGDILGNRIQKFMPDPSSITHPAPNGGRYSK